MKPFSFLLAALSLIMAPSAFASEVPPDAKPLPQAQVRALVGTGQILRLQAVLDMVSRHSPGETLDAHAFGGVQVTYVVLISDHRGHLNRVLVDARTGAFLDLNTQRAQSILDNLARFPE